MKKVKLREIDEDNWEKVAGLETTPAQEEFVAPNVWSIAEWKFNRYAQPWAVYAGKKAVGFVMYESLHEDDAPHDYSIYRLMIAAKHQGQGFGRAALQLTIEEIQKRDPVWRRILICYVPDNKDGARLYASLGFKEIGLDEDGEMIAAIWRDKSGG